MQELPDALIRPSTGPPRVALLQLVALACNHQSTSLGLLQLLAPPHVPQFISLGPLLLPTHLGHPCVHLDQHH